jgi:hypothetical protein
MRRFRAPSSGLDKFFAAQFSAGYITNMSGFDLRQAQPTLRDMLLPQDDRSASLCVGSREFDPVNVGVVKPTTRTPAHSA